MHLPKGKVGEVLVTESSLQMRIGMRSSVWNRAKTDRQEPPLAPIQAIFTLP